MAETARSGGCLCGAVRYTVTGEPASSGICHCGTCRKAASAPTLPFAVFDRSRFAIVRGAPAVFRSSPRVVRSFCGRCGLPLTYANEDTPDMVDIMTGSLDDPAALPPTFSVWTSEKLAWDIPHPGYPAFPRTRAEGLV